MARRHALSASQAEVRPAHAPSLSALFATDPRNCLLSPFVATLPKTPSPKSFVCHTCAPCTLPAFCKSLLNSGVVFPTFVPRIRLVPICEVAEPRARILLSSTSHQSQITSHRVSFFSCTYALPNLQVFYFDNVTTVPGGSRGSCKLLTACDSRWLVTRTSLAVGT